MDVPVARKKLLRVPKSSSHQMNDDLPAKNPPKPDNDVDTRRHKSADKTEEIDERKSPTAEETSHKDSEPVALYRFI